MVVMMTTPVRESAYVSKSRLPKPERIRADAAKVNLRVIELGSFAEDDGDKYANVPCTD